MTEWKVLKDCKPVSSGKYRSDLETYLTVNFRGQISLSLWVPPHYHDDYSCKWLDDELKEEGYFATVGHLLKPKPIYAWADIPKIPEEMRKQSMKLQRLMIEKRQLEEKIKTLQKQLDDSKL